MTGAFCRAPCVTVLCIAGWFFKMAGQAAVGSLPGQVRDRENPTSAQGNP
jgi:hypothetical protein